MGYLILVIISFCAGFAWCYYWLVKPLKKKVEELQKRIINGSKYVK